MEKVFSNPFFVGTFAFILSLGFTYIVRELAQKYGFVAKPKADRWHKKPTALFGGISVFITTSIIFFAIAPMNLPALVIYSASALMFFVGLIDDYLNIKPYQKLFGQLVAASIVVGFGFTLPWTNYQLVNIWITVFWLVGITNAVNLLDNMDGLAAGISAIAAVSVAYGFPVDTFPGSYILLTAFVGSLAGFLIFNFNPASIFMGDCGSLFIGFLLASSVLINQIGGYSRSVFSILAVPALVLFVPIFDTTFVTIIRKLWGRKASQGGRDHTSHRLVALGLSERAAVLLLYALAASAAVVSHFVRDLETASSIALVAAFTVVLVIIGVYLSKVKVYEERDFAKVAEESAVYGFLIDVSYKRRIFEIFLDALLITLAYYASYIVLFREIEGTRNWDLFITSLPILIVAKIGAFLFAGVYRGVWRYTSVNDLVTFAKGILLGSIISVIAILGFYRFNEFSRALFVIDAIVLFGAISGSRIAFRIFRQMLPQTGAKDGRKVMIYGAGDGGEMTLREVQNNRELKYNAVGFIDDDSLKQNKVIHGLRVVGGNGNLEETLRSKEVDEILIACKSMSEERLEEVKKVCRDLEIDLKRISFVIEEIETE